MFTNLSLIFLTSRIISSSPIITSCETSFPVLYNFNKVNIFKILNSFFYQNSCKSKPQIVISNSLFTHSLNSIILISSIEKTDEIISSQIYIDDSIYDSEINVTNCCFKQCSITDPSYINGSAILINLHYYKLCITNSVFVKCTTSGYGGCIYSIGADINIISSLFSECQSDKMGSTIFHEKPDYSPLDIKQTLFIDNVAKNSIIFSNTAENFCQNSNFSRNQNKLLNLPTDQIQTSIYLCWNNQNSDLINMYNNFFKNSGSVLIDMKLKDSIDGMQIQYINMIDNYDLNFFFFYHETTTATAQDPILANFAFFGNTPASQTNGMKIANVPTYKKLILTDCLFEYSEDVVNSMINSHLLDGGNFNQPKKTFAQIEFFIQPTKCAVDIVFVTESKKFSKSDEFTKSLTFSETPKFTFSEKFTKSFYFSESSQFSKSSYFSESSQFTSSLQFISSSPSPFTSSLFFSSSLHFTKSSTFTFSSPFSASSFFSSSESFSLSNLLSYLTPTKEFTPSSHFTPSFFFTPNRTKVPDPPGLQRAQIAKQEKDIFTKEELKKAAAPVSISLVIIVVSIVLCIMYIQRKVKMVKNQDNVPEFDTSFQSEEGDETEYSYSYYTYSYYTPDNSNSSEELEKRDFDESNSDNNYSEFTESDIIYSEFYNDH